MTTVTGLHHVTIISGNAQENLDFYVGVLGMRLVKKTVNQDDPGTYHLFYADAEGHAGTEVTFFPWANMPRGRQGIGLTNELALAVPVGSLAYWAERLTARGVTVGEPTPRFGELAITFSDPHGLSLALVETADARTFTPWAESPVPEQHQVRGLHAVRIAERELGPTAHLLTTALGFAPIATEAGWHRFAVLGGGSGRYVDVREQPGAQRGVWGVGSVHHVAFRVPDDAAEAEVSDQIQAAGVQHTEVIDRFWFRSVYFKEPGGALFELATDGPGFAIDEPMETLGEALVLAPFLEPQRAQIERRLPKLTLPHPTPAGTTAGSPT
jgi:glyoxalase family protein